MNQSPYVRLLVMLGLSFLAMYALMYAMVDSFENVFNNVNQAYMAGLMAAPMGILELLLMRSMYRNRRLNVALLAAGAVLFIGCWFGIRHQAGVGDEQFLRSMIPHHAGAILMCTQTAPRDGQVQDLCGQIVESQQREIAQMKAALRRIGGR